MRPNVVVLCLDTVRADYYAEHAPRLQELADVTIDTCRAASSWSIPSHASLFTGDLPHQHGFHAHNRDFSGLSRADTFLDAFDDYDVRGVSANIYAGPVYNFDGIFDSFTQVSPSRRFPEGMDMEEFIRETEEAGLSRYLSFLRAALDHEATGKTLANGALLKLDDALRALPLPKLLDDGGKIIARQLLRELDASTEPTFLFANFMDAHGSHEHVLGYDSSLHSAGYGWSSRDFDGWEINVRDEVPEEYQRHVENHRGIYRASIDYLDRVVSSTIEKLQARSERPTRVVITADHGENLAYPQEGPMIGHSSSLSEGLLRVPLSVVNAPSGASWDGGWFSHLDLGDLVVGLSRDEWVAPTREVVPSEVVGSGTDYPEADEAYWDRMIRTAVRETEKVTWDSEGGIERHTVGMDLSYPVETEAAPDQVPEWATRAFGDEPMTEYKRRAKERETRVEVDEETEQRLRELGYR